MAAGRGCCVVYAVGWEAVARIIDCVKNLQTSYRALPLYFSFPLWNHNLPARLTQFLRLTS